MIDLSSFLIERARLRRFCFRQTTAAIVVRDVSVSATLPNDRVSRIAELLQILLTIDAARFADPDDPCDYVAPSIFAFPTTNSKQDVAAVLAVSKGAEPIIVDFRLNEMVWPLIAPHLACDIARSTKVWDHTLRMQKRICAIVTRDVRTDDIAIRCDGSALLRQSGGKTFDLASQYWRDVYTHVAAQRCMAREAWRREAYRTEGSA
jgi:hypothetical protein